jgi:hypothetical protein
MSAIEMRHKANLLSIDEDEFVGPKRSCGRVQGFILRYSAS